MRAVIINSTLSSYTIQYHHGKFHINFTAYAFWFLISLVCLCCFIRGNATQIIIFCLTNIYDKPLLKRV